MYFRSEGMLAMNDTDKQQLICGGLAGTSNTYGDK